jgi:hypothetical protein
MSAPLHRWFRTVLQRVTSGLCWPVLVGILGPSGGWQHHGSRFRSVILHDLVGHRQARLSSISIPDDTKSEPQMLDHLFLE